MHQFTRHYDPGHSWLQVPKTVVKSLGQAVCNSLSTFSFQDDSYVYLEEDEDIHRVLEPLKTKGISFKIEDIHHKHEAPCCHFKRLWS